MRCIKEAIDGVLDAIEFLDFDDRIEVLECVISSLQSIRDSSIIIYSRWREEGEDDAED